MFDGTGLNDSPKKSNPRGSYALYKMILWKIAQNITGFTSDGGIRTDYTTIDSISGLTNVETRALAADICDYFRSSCDFGNNS
jgi:hypothetical protein